jgi:hypothetical protein
MNVRSFRYYRWVKIAFFYEKWESQKYFSKIDGLGYIKEPLMRGEKKWQTYFTHIELEWTENIYKPTNFHTFSFKTSKNMIVMS